MVKFGILRYELEQTPDDEPQENWVKLIANKDKSACNDECQIIAADRWMYVSTSELDI